jgi:hypothetical protein
MELYSIKDALKDGLIDMDSTDKRHTRWVTELSPRPELCQRRCLLCQRAGGDRYCQATLAFIPHHTLGMGTSNLKQCKDMPQPVWWADDR